MRYERYEVRMINWGDCGVWEPGELLLATPDEALAKRWADREGTNYQLGVVILDRERGTVDWGDQITLIGEGRK